MLSSDRREEKKQTHLKVTLKVFYCGSVSPHSWHSAPSAGPWWWHLQSPKCPKIRKTCKFVSLVGRTVSQTRNGTWSFLVVSLAVVGSRLAAESTAYSCASLFSTASVSASIFLCSSCSFSPIFCCNSRMVSACVLSSSSRSCSSCRNVQVNIWGLQQRHICHLTSQQHCNSSSCSTFWSLSSFSTCLICTFLTCWDDSSVGYSQKLFLSAHLKLAMLPTHLHPSLLLPGLFRLLLSLNEFMFGFLHSFTQTCVLLLSCWKFSASFCLDLGGLCHLPLTNQTRLTHQYLQKCAFTTNVAENFKCVQLRENWKPSVKCSTVTLRWFLHVFARPSRNIKKPLKNIQLKQAFLNSCSHVLTFSSFWSSRSFLWTAE